MDNMPRKPVSLLCVCLLLLGLLLVPTPTASTDSKATIRVIPQLTELGNSTHPDIECTNFSVAVVVEDVTDFYGLDVQLKWNTTYLEYVSHTVGTPWNANQAVMPPSPYAGILYEPGMQVKDVVDEDGGISGAEPETMGWWGYACMDPAPPFDGDGTVVVLTFHLKYQPWDFEISYEFVDTLIHFVSTDLSNSAGVPLPGGWDVQDGMVRIWSKEFEYPSRPLLKLKPEETSGLRIGETFTTDVWLMGENYTDLEAFWDVAQFDIIMHFNSTLIEASDVTIDPSAWFVSFWPGGLLIIEEYFNNTAGTVRVSFQGLPNSTTGEHKAPQGKGVLFSVDFEVIYESDVYPPPTIAIYLKNPEPRPIVCDRPGDKFYNVTMIVNVTGYPHPDRDMCPWHNKDIPAPIPHIVENATYTTFFGKPPGIQIDLYTQYREPYGGQGPHNVSDMFWTQEEVVLYAYLTYNLWPEQGKDVSFTILDPCGSRWAILFNRTDEEGLATVSFRLPWKGDDPEYYLGEWTVIAEVNVAGEHINDTLTFKYDYLVNTWKVSTDKEWYKHGETIEVTVDHGSYAMQNYEVTYTVTGLDESGCSFGLDNTTVTLGGAEYCSYKNDTTILYVNVAKSARVGLARIHVGALDWKGNPVTPAYTTTIRIGAPVRDVAVPNVWTNVTEVFRGGNVEVSILVGNNGEVRETFNLNIYSNVTRIYNFEVEALDPGETRILSLAWNTSGVEVGSYTIWAEIPPLLGEYETANNVFYDGIVSVLPPYVIKDVIVWSVTPNATRVYQGDAVSVRLVIRNNGSRAESFDLNVYYDSVEIETLHVASLFPHEIRVLASIWNTSGVEVGCYTIWAEIPPLPGELDIEDNKASYYPVKVVARPGVHDIALIDVKPSTSYVYEGQTVDVTIIAMNKGGASETFQIDIYGNESLIGTLTVISLPPATRRTLTFLWTTWDWPKGNYTLWAWAPPVAEEVSTEDNKFVNGVIQITPRPRIILPLLMLLILLLLMLVVVSLLVMVLLGRRRKKKASRNSVEAAIYLPLDRG